MGEVGGEAAKKKNKRKKGAKKGQEERWKRGAGGIKKGGIEGETKE